MSEVGPDPARGRLFLVTGADAAERVTVAQAVARALERSALVDGARDRPHARLGAGAGSAVR